MMLAQNHNFPNNTNYPRATQSRPSSLYHYPQQHNLFAAVTSPASNIPIQSLSQVPDLMPSTDTASWSQMASQQTPRVTHRFGHQRESSLSSLGSNGPASPYAASTSHPQIAISSDSALADSYQDLATSGDANYSFGKSLASSDNYYTTALSAFNGSNNTTSTTTSGSGVGPSVDLSFGSSFDRPDRSLAPPTDSSSTSSALKNSHPVSVASSVAGGDSPATPTHDVEEESRRRGKNAYPVAKLSRTMTDVFGDELYNPHFAMTTMSPPPQTQLAVSPSNELFAQRLQAANKQHLSAAQSPVSNSSRDRSPFRNDSPHFAPLDDFSAGLASTKVEPVQQQRDLCKVERERQAQAQIAARATPQQQATPNTISPKDAVLELNDSDDMNNFPLFDANDTSGGFDAMNMHRMNTPMVQQQHRHQQQPQSLNVAQAQSQQQQLMPRMGPTYHQAMMTATPLQNGFNFSMPTNLQLPQQLPQQYPFVPRPSQQSTPATLSSRVSSMEGSLSDFGTEGPVQRPVRTAADGGTYTCTYHGCTRRFDTPALLQKHKREGHRQANALSSLRGPVATADASMPGSVLNSQAGPHKCERINPSTGKPCNTIFSRPYDLTRHEDTIHNARKQKVRCELCTEEKTFSRADALTRHFRVCHPDVEFPGKHRRRGGATAA
ncbi:uncharacterized protein B0I36DRAFT_28415 [Microdochium trichocladiopsis]|uniref:C2H2-type domain-containing protein n=1 Tax=Microdochium trichocladiopsis TaxID=1682393 RepID=A0A9P9BKC6_9PEZI|nr:uncharacterized protein B0I36DRAFT_28415 [Microdochium trichocladiopsis]KAH7021056.1 hypothetical protein B0I36DRAFT_28415 [Microdochium trichocladiopsis]